MNGFVYDPDPLGLEGRTEKNLWGSLKDWWNKNLLPYATGALQRTLGQFGQPPVQQATGLDSNAILLLAGLYLITRK